jgi:hypothetical protein
MKRIKMPRIQGRPSRALLLILLTLTSALADRQLVPPDMNSLQGAWIGFDDNFLTFYRVELNKNGGGVCANTFVDQPPILYVIKRWSINDYQVTINLVPLERGDEYISMKGRADQAAVLRLEVSATFGGWKRRLELARETELVGKNTAARKAIEEFRIKDRGK